MPVLALLTPTGVADHDHAITVDDDGLAKAELADALRDGHHRLVI